MPYLILFLTSTVIPLIPSIVKGIVSYVAVSVGFSLVAYSGVSFAIDELKDYIQGNMDNLSGDVLSIVALSGLPDSINAILTCLVFSFTLNGMMKGTGYKPSWRKPSNPSDL